MSTSHSQTGDLAAPSVPLPANRESTRASAATLLFVAVYAAAIYLPFLGSSRTLTSHEVMVTHPAQRILSDGEWIVPPYAGGSWLDKPPLVNWVTAIGFALFGFSEFVARLPAALSAIGLSVLVAWIAGRFVGPRAALFAGLVQATTVYTFTHGRLGEIDMPLTLLVAGGNAVLMSRWARGHLDLPWRHGVAFYTLAALAVLAKGLVGAVFLGTTVLAYCAIRRSWKPFRAVVWTPTIVCFFVIAGWWHVAAWLQDGDSAVDQWAYNSLMRFLGLTHLGTESPLFFFWTVPWLFLPWTIALVIGAKQAWRDAHGPNARTYLFLWAWFLGGFVFLTISFFKHKHYIIPALPPLSIICAPLLVRHVDAVKPHAQRFYIIVFTVLLIVYGIVSGVVMPSRDHRRATVDFLHEATARVPADETLYVVGLGQSAAYPYIAHNRVAYIDRPDHVIAALEEAGGGPIWILTLREYEDRSEALGVTLEEIQAEPVRAKHPRPETMVLGRLTRISAPQPSPGEAPATRASPADEP